MYQLEGKVESDHHHQTSEDDTTTDNKAQKSLIINAQNNNPTPTATSSSVPPPSATAAEGFTAAHDYSELHDVWRHGSGEHYGTMSEDVSAAADMNNGPTLIRFGTTAAPTGDVSLTLGLRHAGNTSAADNPSFSLRDFGHS